MNLVLLAGNSIHNKQWIHEVKDELGPLFEHSCVHDYSHWESGEENIDFELEAKKLSTNIDGMNEYVIFAKSIGTLLAVEETYKNTLKPAKCILLGIPLKIIKEKSIPFDTWLSHINVPVTIIQNSKDPLGPCKELKSYVNGRSNIKIIKSDGDSHNYNDLDMIKRTLMDFIK